MIPDLDIYRSAALLVKRHGQDAPIEAAMRADAMLERAAWTAIAILDWSRLISQENPMKRSARPPRTAQPRAPRRTFQIQLDEPTHD